MTEASPVLLIRSHRERGVLIAELSGRLSVGPGVDAFKGELLPEIDAGATRVVLDLSGVSYADSMGIEALVSVYQKTRDDGGGMRVVSPSAKVAQLLELTRLAEVFEIVGDESAAVDSLLAG